MYMIYEIDSETKSLFYYVIAKYEKWPAYNMIHYHIYLYLYV